MRDGVAVYGRNACLALGERRPGAIHRVFHEATARKWVAPLLKIAVARRVPYREVGADELEKIAGTHHHEGVAVVADPLPLLQLPDALSVLSGGLVVALDEVGNPHNLGAILRSAAFFGAKAMIVPSTGKQATLSPAAMRVGQGGAEHVPVIGVTRLGPTLERLARQGYAVVGADAHGGEPLTPATVAPPVIVVLGNEAEGLNREVLAACTRRVWIPGGGAVESLNVSVAAGVLFAFAASAATRRA